MKKGFTFAELMISLVVIAVISAILYPTIAQFTPNANKPLFKSAYKTLTSILYEIINSEPSGLIPQGNLSYEETDEDGNITTKNCSNLCFAFCEKANVMQHENNNNSCEKLCQNNTLTTTNGMRWKFDDYKEYTIYTSSGTSKINAYRIYVDVNASNNDLVPQHIPLDTDPWDNNYNGVFFYTATTDANNGIYTKLPTTTEPSGIFDREKLKTQDTFEFYINEKGKIINISPAGWAHLEDNVQSPD